MELKDVAALLIALFVEIKDVEIGGVESATPKEIISVDFEDVTLILKLIHVLLRPFKSFTSLISTSPLNLVLIFAIFSVKSVWLLSCQ